MNSNPFISGILSLLVPGLGQIYAGEGNKGAAIIVAAIVIANLNIILEHCLLDLGNSGCNFHYATKIGGREGTDAILRVAALGASVLSESFSA